MGSNQYPRSLIEPSGQNVHPPMGPNRPINLGYIIYRLVPHDYGPKHRYNGLRPAAIPRPNLAQPTRIQLVPPWSNSGAQNLLKLDIQFDCLSSNSEKIQIRKMDQDNEVSSRQPMQAVQEEFQTLQYENTQNKIRPGDKEE